MTFTPMWLRLTGTGANVEISRLVQMANQIADFFRAYTREEAVAGIEGHFRQFWDPRMRRQILDHLETGGEGLDPLCLAALVALRGKKTSTP